jgi:pimeloyl-ACP methyl ester carboxylesterase
VMTYRNDVGAPAAQFQRYGLGLAEQLDVDAAVGWVRSQGATRVTLVGWSMGGTACVLAQANGRNVDLIDGMVLDSPALDWTGLLRRQARLSRVPSFIADLGIALLQLGLVRGAVLGEKGTDMRALTAPRLITSIRVPSLIHASPGDTFVPWQGSLRAAQHKPQLVRLHAARGEHVKLWNVDPQAWESETTQFIRDLDVSRTTARG